MIIDTNILGAMIIQEAEGLMLMPCLEKSNRNDGVCVTDIVRAFNPKMVRIGSQYAYCAMTASVVLDRAFARVNQENPPAIGRLQRPV